MSIFDEHLKAQIVLAASITAGAGATEEQVAEEAKRIIARLSPGSTILYEFDRADKREENTEKVKTFKATIVAVDKELSSTRGVVFLKTQPSKWHPDGKEHMRTDRTDSTEGKTLAKLAQSLIGHQVTVTVGIENGSDNRVRVLRGLKDDGVDPKFNPSDAEYQPSFDKLDVSKLASQNPTLPAA